MFSSRRSVDKLLQLYKNEIRRQISKTTSVTNSDAMIPRFDQVSLHAQQNEDAGHPNRLLKLQKYHRSVNFVKVILNRHAIFLSTGFLYRLQTTVY